MKKRFPSSLSSPLSFFLLSVPCHVLMKHTWHRNYKKKKKIAGFVFYEQQRKKETTAAGLFFGNEMKNVIDIKLHWASECTSTNIFQHVQQSCNVTLIFYSLDTRPFLDRLKLKYSWSGNIICYACMRLKFPELSKLQLFIVLFNSPCTYVCFAIPKLFEQKHQFVPFTSYNYNLYNVYV